MSSSHQFKLLMCFCSNPCSLTCTRTHTTTLLSTAAHTHTHTQGDKRLLHTNRNQHTPKEMYTRNTLQIDPQHHAADSLPSPACLRHYYRNHTAVARSLLPLPLPHHLPHRYQQPPQAVFLLPLLPLTMAAASTPPAPAPVVVVDLVFIPAAVLMSMSGATPSCLRHSVKWARMANR